MHPDILYAIGMAHRDHLLREADSERLVAQLRKPRRTLMAILRGMANGIPTKLGHVALRVRDLDRAVEFYRDVVGLPLRSRHGDAVAFLGVRADASHEVALFALPTDAPGPEANRVGMYHMAWEMGSFEDLQAFHDRLVDHKAKITGYSDRQCNVMFLDPDGNELEAVWEPVNGYPRGDLPRLKTKS